MAERCERGHYIPLSRASILQMILADGTLAPADAERIQAFARILQSLYHFEFHAHLEELKASYGPFNPDIEPAASASVPGPGATTGKVAADSGRPGEVAADPGRPAEVTADSGRPGEATAESGRSGEVPGAPGPPGEPGELTAQEQRLENQLELMLEDADYEEIPAERLKAALEAEGLFPVSLDADFEDFESYRVFFQGESNGEALVAGSLPWRHRKIHFRSYERLILILKLKGAEHFAAKQRSWRWLRAIRHEELPGRPGKIYLKYLRGVPVDDVEMIFPNNRPRMKLVHKLKIGVPLAFGLAITIYKLMVVPMFLRGSNPWSQGLSLGLIAILGGLGAYVFKAWSGYRRIVQDFLSEITTSLYFKNISNNQGVLAALIDSAEEQESKEALLAYYFLLQSERPVSPAELDEVVERWLAARQGPGFDFETDDALRKLEELGLLRRDAQGKLGVLGLEDALRRLDGVWDGYFDWHRQGAGERLRPGAVEA